MRAPGEGTRPAGAPGSIDPVLAGDFDLRPNAGGRVADDAGDCPAGGRAGRWHVSDLEAKLAEVTAAGATAKEPAHDVRGGRLVPTITDPDGNVLGLLQDR